MFSDCAISVACPLYSVIRMSSAQFAALRRGLHDLSNMRAAVPLPPNGLMRTLNRFRSCDSAKKICQSETQTWPWPTSPTAISCP